LVEVVPALEPEYEFLVFIRTEHPTDQLYRAVGAKDKNEVMTIIASLDVPIGRVVVARPVSLAMQLGE
jgi:hypothetical protein